MPLKAVVTTSDSWPQFGGIREYAARGIPTYLLDRNVPQIRRALESPHRFHPGAGAPTAGRGPGAREHANRNRPRRQSHRAPAGPRGDRGAHDARVSPGCTNLYASDLFQSGREGPPEYAWEVAEVARREKLVVATVFAMHSDPMPWAKLLGLATPPAGASP